jgi:hypothetical protein
MRVEPVVLKRKPDWVLVYGDVNSTAAAALVRAAICGRGTGHCSLVCPLLQNIRLYWIFSMCGFHAALWEDVADGADRCLT